MGSSVIIAFGSLLLLWIAASSPVLVWEMVKRFVTSS